MNEVNNNKQKYLFLVGIVTLLLLVVGASYAYFAVTTVNNFGTSTINATAGGIGSVTLNGTNANLSMDLTAVDMVQGNSDVTYYASASGKTTTPTTVVLGTASVSPTSDANRYHCTYTLSVTHTGTNDMYDLFNHKTGNAYDYANRSYGQIVLYINNEEKDFYNGWPTSNQVSGSFYIKGTQTKDITASLVIKNRSNIDQSYLAGSDIQISIGLVPGSFSCTIADEENWVYYGWYGPSAYSVGCTVNYETCADTYSTFDAARGDHLVALRSNTGNAEYDLTYSPNEDNTIQVCGLINGTMVCADYLDSARNVGTFEYDDENDIYVASDGNVSCSIEEGYGVYCSDIVGQLINGIGYQSSCEINSNGLAQCYN